MLASLAAGVRNLHWFIRPFGWLLYLVVALVVWILRAIAFVLELSLIVIRYVARLIFRGLNRFVRFLFAGTFLEKTIKLVIALFAIGYILTHLGAYELGAAVMLASAIPMMLFGLGMIINAAR